MRRRFLSRRPLSWLLTAGNSRCIHFERIHQHITRSRKHGTPLFPSPTITNQGGLDEDQYSHNGRDRHDRPAGIGCAAESGESRDWPLWGIWGDERAPSPAGPPPSASLETPEGARADGGTGKKAESH